jgi:hypothetical protein
LFVAAAVMISLSPAFGDEKAPEIKKGDKAPDTVRQPARRFPSDVTGPIAGETGHNDASSGAGLREFFAKSGKVRGIWKLFGNSADFFSRSGRSGLGVIARRRGEWRREDVEGE